MIDGIPNRPLYFHQKDIIVNLSTLGLKKKLWNPETLHVISISPRIIDAPAVSWNVQNGTSPASAGAVEDAEKFWDKNHEKNMGFPADFIKTNWVKYSQTWIWGNKLG